MPASSNNPPSSDYSLGAPSNKLPDPDYNLHTDYQPNTEEATSSSVDEDRKIPSQSLTPPSEYAPSTTFGVNTSQVPKKPKRKPSFGYPATQTNDDDDEGKKQI